MKSINRRDYLKNMGIAAAGTIAAGGLNLFSSNGRAFAGNPDNRLGLVETLPEPEIVTAPQASPSDWQWTNVGPGDANPGVRLIFIGMIVFTHKDDEGRVVFHRGPHHNLRIVVLEKCKEIFSYGGGINPAPIDKMTLRVEGKPKSVRFYRSTSTPLNRLTGDRKDFRWLLDLESSPFHHGKLPRKEAPDRFSTKLELEQGTFYTYQHTYATFKAKSNCAAANCKCGVVSCQCNCQDVGHVASVMAADIAANGDEVSFKIDFKGPDEITLPPLRPNTSTGLTYEIYFLNGYQTASTLGDFHMVFDAVEANPSQTFDLELAGRGRDVFPGDLCVNKPPYKPNKSARRGKKQSGKSSGKLSTQSLDDLVEILLNDEAPCMGAGLGFGGGFP